MRMLVLGRVSMIYLGVQSVAILCKELELDYNLIEPVLVIQVTKSSIAMSKNSDMEIVKKWQDVAKEIKADGTYKKIATKWKDYSKEVYGIDCEIKDGGLNFWKNKE